MGYVVKEPSRLNIEPHRLRELGFVPGPWLQELKEVTDGQPETIEIGATVHDRADLQRKLLVKSAGQSLAYFTDFCLDELTTDALAHLIPGSTTLICESQYRAADGDLAARNFHLTAPQAAELAQRAQVDELVLMHVSRRYTSEEMLEILSEAQEAFPPAKFPSHWSIRATDRQRH